MNHAMIDQTLELLSAIPKIDRSAVQIHGLARVLCDAAAPNKEALPPEHQELEKLHAAIVELAADLDAEGYRSQLSIKNNGAKQVSGIIYVDNQTHLFGSGATAQQAMECVYLEAALHKGAICR